MMLEKSIVENFELRVRKNLEEMGFAPDSVSETGLSVASGVSGGADSVALFVALCRIFKNTGVPVSAVSVDHRIRSSEESGGDAEYVRELCRSLKEQGFCCSVSVVTLEDGQVFALADKRGNGVEEAARFLRYEVFDNFIKENSPVFFALAHNRNDQIETVLMRFLQGSGSAGLGGIARIRGSFVRPLINIDRCEIESYLNCLGIRWRTDSTNFDIHYLRNRIRQKLVPFLQENFPGFEKAVLSGSEKAFLEDRALELMVPADFWNYDRKNCCVEASAVEFASFPFAIQFRLLYRAFDLLGGTGRFPYQVMKGFLESVGKEGNKGEAFSGGVGIVSDGRCVCVKKERLVATESSFFGIIKESGRYPFPLFEAVVRVENGMAEVSVESEKDSVVLKKVPVPFCIRSRQCGDAVRNSRGGFTGLSDIFSDWHAAGLDTKNSIPLIQELCSPEQNIVAVCGSVLGFKNWIVRDFIPEGKNE